MKASNVAADNAAAPSDTYQLKTVGVTPEEIAPIEVQLANSLNPTKKLRFYPTFMDTALVPSVIKNGLYKEQPAVK